MFFILSKTVAALLLPSTLIVVIGLLGLLLLAMRRRRAGIGLMIASLALLIAAGVSPLAGVLGHMLESRFPKWDPARGAPDGIVVLGGAISPELSRQHGEPVLGADAGRVVAIAKLARDYPNARIIYSGGDASWRGNKMAEAPFLTPLLDGFGIAHARVALEPRSRNTAENAIFSKEVAQPKPSERWLLVTSAQHMPRAVGCFRQADFPVEAYPVAWRTELELKYRPSLRIGNNLARLDSVVNEWIGLLAYWVTGRTSALLPAP